MSGEVRGQLTITLQGGVGAGTGAPGGSSTPTVAGRAPVSRKGDQLGPAQSMSNYAASRHANWSSVMAMEAAKDRQAMAEVHRGLEKLEVSRQLEVSSQLRARQAFAERIRNNTFATGTSLLEESVFEKKLARKAKYYAKGWLKGGLKAGFGAFMVGEFTNHMPEGGGIHGAALRVHAAQLAGAGAGFVLGGPVGAAGGAALGTIVQSISEVKNYISDLYQMGQKLQDEIKRREKLLLDLKADIEEFKKESMDELKAALKEARDEVAEEASKRTYRTTRYVYANLTGGN